MSLASIESSAPSNISLAEGFELRKMHRESTWEVDFKKNHEKVASTIAHNITEKIKKILTDSVRDPYKRLPSLDKPIALQYTFQIIQPKNVKQIWEYAGDSAELAPFNEWFSRFADEEETNLDYEYFQPLISKIGYLAMTHVCNNLESYKKIAENSSLKCEIETQNDVYSFKLWTQKQKADSEATEDTTLGLVNNLVSWGTKMINEGYSSF